MTEETRGSILLPPWNGMSLPGLTRGAALLRSETVLFRDGADSARLAGRPPLELTGQDLDNAVDLMTRKLILLGLTPGDRIVIMLPNIVEAVVSLLAVMRAGGVAVALPVFADLETVTAATLLGEAAGLVTVAEFAGLRPAETARAVAAAALSMRFVACHGRRAPEGVAALDALTRADVEGIELPLAPAGTAPALITLDLWQGAPRGLVRSHEQLIAEAAAAAALARITETSRLIGTMAPASLAGVVHGLALPLLTGASTDLVPLFDSAAFARALGDGAGLTVLLPAAAEAAYRGYCDSRPAAAEGLVLVHRPEPGGALHLARPEGAAGRTVDVVCLGEIAMAGFARSDLVDAPMLPVAPVYPVPGVLAGTASGLMFQAGAGREVQVCGPLAPQVLCLGESAALAVLPSLTAEPAAPRLVSAA